MVLADRRRARHEHRAGEHHALTADAVAATPPIERAQRGPLGLLLVLVTLAGAAIAGYLTAVRLLGTNAVCGPSHGCDLVAASEYAEVLGVPVTVLGLAASVLLLALAAAWWLRAERRALLGAYLLLLLSTGFVAYLTFLELFVIEAICIWCVAYAVTVVVALVVAGLALRRSSVQPEPA